MATRWILFLFLALSVTASAQYTTAGLGGTISDNSGSPVPEAKVSVRNIATGFSATTTSGEDGTFLFPRLPVGDYELTADKSGFATYLQKGITLAVNQLANQTITLRVGQVSEQVTVEANADLVDTRSGTVDSWWIRKKSRSCR
jgi:hypothetical protein